MPSSKRFILSTGCNLSPLLFALFISALGDRLNSTNLGIPIGGIIITAIFFADDIVIIGKTRGSLNKLMIIVKEFFQNHGLVISQTKSKIMSHDALTGETTFSDSSENQFLCLDQVLSFNYLGTSLSCAPYQMFRVYNSDVKKKAASYFRRVLSISKTGPDRAKLAHSLWCQVALPSILYGSEVIPLTECTIQAIEKFQAAIGKFIMQVPSSTSNVIANIDAGLRPVSSIVAERVLLYANKVMRAPDDHWSKIAMNENISLGLNSTYTRYLLKIKNDNNCFGVSDDQIKRRVGAKAVTTIRDIQEQVRKTTFPLKTPTCFKMKHTFRMKSWVSDSGVSKIFSQFRVLNTGLGNRGPASDGQHYKQCILCDRTGLIYPNNEVDTYF